MSDAKKHSMIVVLDLPRSEAYKKVAKLQGKTMSNWVRALCDSACRKAGVEPEQMLDEVEVASDVDTSPK